MIYYGLSEQRIRRVVSAPKRREEGIAEGTSAAMQPSPSKKRKEEIWVMYKTVTNDKRPKTRKQQEQKNTSGQWLGASGTRILMISAWRYPGVTKPGKAIPIPEDALAELAKIL